MVHLHCHSCYSLLNGTMDVETLVQNAVAKHIDALCLSDHHSMHAALNFYKACKKAGIKPLLGLEVSVMFDEDDVVLVNLIAKNYTGYQDLLRLSSYLCTHSASTLPFNELGEYVLNCAVIMLLGGGYETALLQERWDDAWAYITKLQDVIPVNINVGLLHGESSLWHERNKQLFAQCQEKKMVAVAVHRILYENPKEEKLLQVLKAIDKGVSLASMGTPDNIGRYFATREEMNQFYLPEALANADELAACCVVDIPDRNIALPKFPTPNQVDSKLYLKELCSLGLAKRLQNRVDEAYKKRLDYELQVIFTMHFEDYFLIVWDYVRYARSVGIMVGVGRGSAAGSLVAYVLGITHVDPLAYDLLFERFLNPERISMPDIDVDFPDNRRDEVIEYVKNKYGIEHVAHISTFGTLKAKQVLRDVARVMGITSYDLDILSKKIPFSPSANLKDTYEHNSSFRQAVESKPVLKQLYATALRLEGLPRHISTHAAGIVISKEPLVENVPLISIETDMYSTQFQSDNLESLGILKMDVRIVR